MVGALRSVAGRRLGVDVTNGDLYQEGRPILRSASNQLVAATAATLTATQDLHAGKVIKLDRAAGVTVTLPAASGSGDTYIFVVTTAVTSNNDIVKVANASDTMVGQAVQTGAAGANTSFLASGTSDTITLNGTTTGGIKGDYIFVQDVATNLWLVNIQGSITGTAATPFSATV